MKTEVWRHEDNQELILIDEKNKAKEILSAKDYRNFQKWCIDPKLLTLEHYIDLLRWLGINGTVIDNGIWYVKLIIDGSISKDSRDLLNLIVTKYTPAGYEVMVEIHHKENGLLEIN